MENLQEGIIYGVEYSQMCLSRLQRIAIAPTQYTASRLQLTPEQYHYLGRVLRLRQGDRFIAMDGQGHWWLSELSAAPLEAQVLSAIAINTELPVAVTLLIAMPKGTGMEDIVRQGTELGVTMIVPVVSDRTLLHPSPPKLERWRRIAQEAAEQAERQIIPHICDPLSLTETFNRWNSTHCNCYICEARTAHPHLLTCLTLPSSPSLTIATGPEGGWTDQELAGAIAAGYQPVSLGQRILRAVTAPLVALSLINGVCETVQETQECLDTN